MTRERVRAPLRSYVLPAAIGSTSEVTAAGSRVRVEMRRLRNALLRCISTVRRVMKMGSRLTGRRT